jgi:hypothetical protein
LSDLVTKPASRNGPIAFNRPTRDREYGRDLVDPKTPVEAHLHYREQSLVEIRQAPQDVAKCNRVRIARCRQGHLGVQWKPLMTSWEARASGAVDQDAAHDKGRHSDKVSDILEPELGFAAGDPQQCLVKQVSRLHARLGKFFSEEGRGPAMEFAIDRFVQRLEGRCAILIEFRYHPQRPPPWHTLPLQRRACALSRQIDIPGYKAGGFTSAITRVPSVLVGPPGLLMPLSKFRRTHLIRTESSLKILFCPELVLVYFDEGLSPAGRAWLRKRRC